MFVSKQDRVVNLILIICNIYLRNTGEWIWIMGIYIKSNINVWKTPTSRTMNLKLLKFPLVQLTRFRLVQRQSATVTPHTCAQSWHSPFKLVIRYSQRDCIVLQTNCANKSQSTSKSSYLENIFEWILKKPMIEEISSNFFGIRSPIKKFATTTLLPNATCND